MEEVEEIKDTEITEDEFRGLLSVVSEWYDSRGYISMLKVLYTDLVTMSELYKASKTRDLLQLLIDAGLTDATDPTLIYETINATKQFGLEKTLKKRIPSFPNVKEIKISTFEIHRLRLKNLGELLVKEDIEKISELYITPVKKYADSWSLILDLEKQRIISANQMESFIKNLRDLNLNLAVEALESEPKSSCTPPGLAAIDVILGRCNRESNCEPENVEYHESPLALLVKVLNNVGKLTIDEYEQFIKKLNEIKIYVQQFQAKICNLSSGSLIFHLTASDPAALQFLWKTHKSKELIKHLAKLLVSEKFQQDFLDKWTTEIDRDQYEASLRKLERKDKLKLKTPAVSRAEKHTTPGAGPSQKKNPLTAVECKQDLLTNECEKQKLQTSSETEQEEKIKQVKQTNLIQVEKIKDLKFKLEMLKKRKSIKKQKSPEEIRQEIMHRKKLLKLVFLFSLQLQSVKHDYSIKYRCLTDALADEIEQVHQKIQIQREDIKELQDELYYIYEMSKIEDSKEVQKKQARIEQEIEQRMKDEKSQRLAIQKLLSHKWDLETQHQNLERSMADALTDKDMFKKEDSKEELKKYDIFEQELIMQRKEKILVICFYLQLRSLQSALETEGHCTFDALLMDKIEKERQKYQVQRDKTQDLQVKLKSRSEKELKTQYEYEQEIKQSNDAVKSQKLVIQQLEILQRNPTIENQGLKNRAADMPASKKMVKIGDPGFSDETKQLKRSMVGVDKGPSEKFMKMGPSEMYECSDDFNF